MTFLNHVSLFGEYVRAKCQNSPQVTNTGYNLFIRFFVSDLFVGLIALMLFPLIYTFILEENEQMIDYKICLLVLATNITII